MPEGQPVRGQSLLLFVFMLLPVAFMVLVTLGVTMKVREKIELQTLADAAAYNNAVATARTFNTVALLNRVIVGQMVAAASAQAVNSWAGHYDTFIHALKAGIPVDAAGCPNAAQVKAAFDAELDRDHPIFDPEDTLSADQIREIYKSALSVAASQRALYDKLASALGPGPTLLAQTLLTDAMRQSRWPGELSTNPLAAQVSAREIGGDLSSPEGSTVLAATPGSKDLLLFAAMGSRGNNFLTSRSHAALQARLQQVAGPLITIRITGSGSTYWARNGGSGMQWVDPAFRPQQGATKTGGQRATDDYLWAEDHGVMQVLCCPPPGTAPGCKSASAPFDSFAVSTDSTDPFDAHKHNMKVGGGPPIQPGGTEYRHDMGPCGGSCPTVWPSFLDFNRTLVDKPDDLFGQPKNQVMVQRDYAARAGGDPWNLLVRIRLFGGPSTLDNRGVRLANGTDISKQGAFATGLAYYHRYGHWEEPPNFLNPFWRATLVPSNIDRQSVQPVGTQPSDVARALSGFNSGEALNAFELFNRAGFKGWH